MLLAILYTEIFSQPILATAPIFGHMTASEILRWYALSTVMHSIYGIVLGVTLSYGRPLFPHFQTALSGSLYSR
jgi:hypothetical protein